MTRGTVLVVEDDPLSRELVLDLLAAAGYAVLQVEDGVGLLERVRRERPALILLDLQLPGVDGFTLARQLTADPLTRGTPLLAATAHAQPEVVALALQAGCVAVLSKPLDMQGLVSTVARLVGGPHRPVREEMA